MHESITLILPLPPNLGNARMHWRTKNTAKHKYWELLDHLWLVGMIPRAESTMQKSRIEAQFVVGSRMDTDNSFARLKWALDWLKSADYITDDSPKHLEWVSIPTQEITRKKPYSLTLTLTPIDL